MRDESNRKTHVLLSDCNRMCEKRFRDDPSNFPIHVMQFWKNILQLNPVAQYE